MYLDVRLLGGYLAATLKIVSGSCKHGDHDVTCLRVKL